MTPLWKVDKTTQMKASPTPVVKDIISALREELRKERLDKEKLTHQAARTSMLESQVKDFEKKFEAYYAAVGTLAHAIPPVGRLANREIRAKARKLLVSAGIQPPPSLGSPRVRKSKKRKRLRKSAEAV